VAFVNVHTFILLYLSEKSIRLFHFSVDSAIFRLMNIPYFKQQTIYTCGPTVMKMVLASLGLRYSERELAKLMETTEERGTSNAAFPRLAEKLKRSYHVERNAKLETLRTFHQQQWRIIVALYIPDEKEGHYAVVRAIGKDVLTFLDPAFGPSHRINTETFLTTWHNHPKDDNEQHWFIAIR
jgi:ABC-type bacteriocin/lantibiotic exporter with double-glycine peptidase domain